MSFSELQYLHLLEDLLEQGESVEDRTNTGTLSKFGHMMRFDLSKGFPLWTTKKINFGLVAGELEWFLSGKTDLPSLRKFQDKPEGSHTIWSDDFKKFWDMSLDGDYYRERECGGSIYGEQLRSYGENKFDQLTHLIDNLKAVIKDPSHPSARRLKCDFWNPYDHLVGDKEWTALPACHLGFQCLIRDGKLNLSFQMRSSDSFLGLPYNISSYALLTHILAKLTGLEVGELVYFGVDVHLYSNHVEAVKEQLSREMRPLPKLVLPEFETLEELLQYTGKDFKLEGYDPHPFIKAKQAS